jgi:phosphoglycerate dehydrogenase-like enzyme
MMRIAILDDYQRVALEMADWSAVSSRADITVFSDHLANPAAVVDRLEPFDIICVMRERTPLPRAILERLPRLRVIGSTGPGNSSIDVQAAAALGIEILHTGYFSQPTIEHTWALILSALRKVVMEANSVRDGGWQTSVGVDLAGKTLGLLGLGRVGGGVARIGQAFGMQTIAWSQNLTAARAQELGVARVEPEELFSRSDVLSVHVVLSERTRGLVGAPQLFQMRSDAWLINTSRGPIVDETALLEALRQGRLAGAAIDVFATEPLPVDHPFRRQPNLLVTPHVGYVTENLYRTFYGDTVRNLADWLTRGLDR